MNEVSPRPHPLPADDPKLRSPDISRARHMLGWEPKVPLEDGLASTISFLEKALATGKQSNRLAGR